MGRKYHLRIHRSQYFATRLQFVGANTSLSGCHRRAGGHWFCVCPTSNRILLQEGVLGDEDCGTINCCWSVGHFIGDCLQAYMVTKTEAESTIMVERELVSQQENVINALARLGSAGGRLLGTYL